MPWFPLWRGFVTRFRGARRFPIWTMMGTSDEIINLITIKLNGYPWRTFIKQFMTQISCKAIAFKCYEYQVQPGSSAGQSQLGSGLGLLGHLPHGLQDAVHHLGVQQGGRDPPVVDLNVGSTMAYQQGWWSTMVMVIVTRWSNMILEVQVSKLGILIFASVGYQVSRGGNKSLDHDQWKSMGPIKLRPSKQIFCLIPREAD